MTKYVKPTVSNLTASERLRLARRRTGLSGPDLAKKLGMRRHDLQNMELGTKEPEGKDILALIRTVKTASISELCYVARLRSGQDTSAVADDVGLSRQWVCLMERGKVSADKLATHWGL